MTLRQEDDDEARGLCKYGCWLKTTSILRGIRMFTIIYAKNEWKCFMAKRVMSLLLASPYLPVSSSAATNHFRLDPSHVQAGLLEERKPA